MSKYYKHTYTFTVLSQSEEQELNPLENLGYHVSYGEDSLYGTDHALEEVDGKEMAKLLYDAGSDPEFFNLSPELLEENE